MLWYYVFMGLLLIVAFIWGILTFSADDVD
jgi:hypothetical protein